MTVNVPCGSVRAYRAVAVTADQLATQAAMSTFTLGGNAVDAAVAANAALAVTAPHLCGMGGDLFALVRTSDGDVVGLNASGRAGSGADPAAMRAERLATMPLRHDIRSVTVPGCVDGWIALHERFGAARSGDRAEPGDPSRRSRVPGQPAAGRLARARSTTPGGSSSHELADQATATGAMVRRPGVALTLQAIVAGGRSGFYGGAFGEGLLHVGAGLFTPDDLATVQADWVAPLAGACLRRRPGDDRAELPGLPDAGRGQARGTGGHPRGSRRRGVGPPADRGGDRGVPRSARRPPRGCRR